MNTFSEKLKLIILVWSFCLFSLKVNSQVAQFGGPERNGIYPESGLLDHWPENGPELVETLSGIGEGYGSTAVNEQGIWIAGMIDTTGFVFHFNHNHELIWKRKIGPEFNYKYVGSRGTPTIVGDRLYYVASLGDAVCLNAFTGEEIWHLNIFDKFQGQKVKWGYTESPLIYGEKIFFTPGGLHKNVVALNKKDGSEIWTSDIDSTINAYCSPVIINHKNRDVLLLNTRDYILLLNPENGEVLIRHPLTNSHFNHALAPLYEDGKLFYSSGYGEGATLFRINDEEAKLDTLYSNPDFDCKLSGMINYKGTVFGTSDQRKMWMGVDIDSGETVFTSRELKPGSLILADDKFFLYSDVGEVALAIPSEAGLNIVSRFQIPAGRVSMAFAHPVLYDGILYIRYNNDLWLYSVK